MARLWDGGCLGVQVRAKGRTSRLTLDAYYPVQVGRTRLGRRLRLALRGLAGREALSVRVRPVGAGRWVEKWQRTLRPMAIGRFLVVPEGCVAPASRPRAHTLRVRFGQAFGTGEHASTRLCLRLLQSRVVGGESVADLGTGTGILAMAACRLGAGRVIAIDNDDVALEVARLNLADNGVSERIVLLRAEADEVVRHGPFDLILVNIGAATIARILPALATALAPGGRAILAGLLAEDEAGLLRAARRHRLALVERRRARPWSSLVLRRPMALSRRARPPS